VLPDRAWLPHALIRKPDGKWDKPPRSGATSNNPASWFTLDGALQKFVEVSDVSGVAFAITKGLISLDFDDCRDQFTGELDDEVQELLEKFDSYAYVTPSGKGIRIVGINDSNHPIEPQKSNRWMPGKHKIEIFIGPVNFYNTFTSQIIPGYDVIRDISSLTIDCLAFLDAGKRATNGSGRTAAASNPDPQRSIAAIRAALAIIPNHAKDWDEWCRIGMAVWRSSGGSGAGMDAWIEWSDQLDCFSLAACHERWQHWFESPPTKIGFGTLYYEARKIRPLFVPPFDPVQNGHDSAVENAGQGRDKPRPAPTIRLYTMRELDALPPPEWIIEGLIPENALVVPFGPPKSGKTFIVLSMCLHVSAGRDWFGYPVRQGGVVYIAGEGSGGLQTRLRAMRSAYQISIDEPFWTITRAVNFRQATEVTALAEAVRATVGNTHVRMVVIDTLARAMPGADENSAQEVGLVIAGCDALRDELGCSTMPIHHSGKDTTKGARGTSALRGAWDTALEITAAGQRTIMTVADQKEAEAGQRLVFRMDKIAISLSRSSLVPMLEMSGIAPEEGGEAPSDRGLRDRPMIALQSLRDALASEDAAVLPWFAGKPDGDVTGLHVETWRRKFYERMPSMTQEARKKAFQRVVEELTKRRLVGVSDPWVWLVK
jgi:hypothetical protein